MVLINPNQSGEHYLKNIEHALDFVDTLSTKSKACLVFLKYSSIQMR